MKYFSDEQNNDDEKPVRKRQIDEDYVTRPMVKGI